jgi:CCDC81-like HU domain protein/sporulation related protein
MDIGFYIADLLLKQDEVSLPGLGTFTKERVAGSYDQSSNSFIPPSYQVSFDDTETNHDSLAEYISTQKNLSRSSADYFVRKFTSTVFDLLQTSGIAEVKPLGIIRQKDENLSFEASQNFDVGGNNYGLKTISDLKPVSIPVRETVTDIPFIETISPEDIVAEQETVEEEELQEPSRRSRPEVWVFGSIVTILIAASLLYFFSPPVNTYIKGVFLQTKQGGNKPAAPAQNAPPAVVVTDSVDTPPDSSLNDSVKMNAAATETEPAVIAYEIIGGSFGRKSEADTYISQLKKNGIEAHIVENMPGKLFKVSLATFHDPGTAQTELARFQKEITKTAWIATVKPKKIK